MYKVEEMYAPKKILVKIFKMVVLFTQQFPLARTRVWYKIVMHTRQILERIPFEINFEALLHDLPLITSYQMNSEEKKKKTNHWNLLAPTRPKIFEATFQSKLDRYRKDFCD